MGHFDAQGRLYCQNDEVSPDVHTRLPTDVTRKGRQIPPLSDAASCSCPTAPHLTQRGILNEVLFERFLGDYD